MGKSKVNVRIFEDTENHFSLQTSLINNLTAVLAVRALDQEKTKVMALRTGNEKMINTKNTQSDNEFMPSTFAKFISRP